MTAAENHDVNFYNILIFSCFVASLIKTSKHLRFVILIYPTLGNSLVYNLQCTAKVNSKK